MNSLAEIYSLASVRAGRCLLREEGDAAREQESGSKSYGGVHQSVLTQEVLALLDLHDGDTVIDATAGEGGHSEALVKGAAISLISIDADPAAVAHTKKRLAPWAGAVQVVEGNFADIENILTTLGVPFIDKGLFDLGWNRGQLTSGRGFSFTQEEPLDMSYGIVPASGFNARDMLNTWSEEALANIFYGYGEERYARRIAKNIIEARAKAQLTTTTQLVEIVERSVPTRSGGNTLHPATRTFQALRIAVNDELGVLDRGVKSAWSHLRPGGRLAVISFHSTEDRIVKRLFQAFAKSDGVLLTKKPVIAGAEELSVNRAARSAKLRAIQKI